MGCFHVSQTVSVAYNDTKMLSVISHVGSGQDRANTDLNPLTLDVERLFPIYPRLKEKEIAELKKPINMAYCQLIDIFSVRFSFLLPCPIFLKSTQVYKNCMFFQTLSRQCCVDKNICHKEASDCYFKVSQEFGSMGKVVDHMMCARLLLLQVWFQVKCRESGPLSSYEEVLEEYY